MGNLGLKPRSRAPATSPEHLDNPPSIWYSPSTIMAERVQVNLPQAFPQCSSCEFAQRASQQAQEQFPRAGTINLECEPSMGGGAKQNSQGVFIEYRSRNITAIPTNTEPNVKSEHSTGHIPTCPIDIDNAAEEYPNLPVLKRTYTDRFERVFSE